MALTLNWSDNFQVGVNAALSEERRCRVIVVADNDTSATAPAYTIRDVLRVLTGNTGDYNQTSTDNGNSITNPPRRAFGGGSGDGTAVWETAWTDTEGLKYRRFTLMGIPGFDIDSNTAANSIRHCEIIIGDMNLVDGVDEHIIVDIIPTLIENTASARNAKINMPNGLGIEAPRFSCHFNMFGNIESGTINNANPGGYNAYGASDGGATRFGPFNYPTTTRRKHFGSFQNGVQTGSVTINHRVPVTLNSVIDFNSGLELVDPDVEGFHPFENGVRFSGGNATNLDRARRIQQFAFYNFHGETQINGPRGLNFGYGLSSPDSLDQYGSAVTGAAYDFSNQVNWIYDFDFIGGEDTVIRSHDANVPATLNFNFWDLGDQPRCEMNYALHSSNPIKMNFMGGLFGDNDDQTTPLVVPRIATIQPSNTTETDTVTGENVVNVPVIDTYYAQSDGYPTQDESIRFSTFDYGGGADVDQHPQLLSNVEAPIIRYIDQGTGNTNNPPVRMLRNPSSNIEFDENGTNNVSLNYLSRAYTITNGDATGRINPGWIVRKRLTDSDSLLDILTDVDNNAAATIYSNRSETLFNYDRKWEGYTHDSDETVEIDIIYGLHYDDVTYYNDSEFVIIGGRNGTTHNFVKVTPTDARGVNLPGGTGRTLNLLQRDDLDYIGPASKFTIGTSLNESDAHVATITVNADATVDELQYFLSTVPQQIVDHYVANDKNDSDNYENFARNCTFLNDIIPNLQDNGGNNLGFQQFRPWSVDAGEATRLLVPFSLTIPSSVTFGPTAGDTYTSVGLAGDATELTGEISEGGEIIGSQAPYIRITVADAVENSPYNTSVGQRTNSHISVYKRDSETGIRITRIGTTWGTDNNQVFINRAEDDFEAGDTVIYIMTVIDDSERVGFVPRVGQFTVPSTGEFRQDLSFVLDPGKSPSLPNTAIGVIAFDPDSDGYVDSTYNEDGDAWLNVRWTGSIIVDDSNRSDPGILSNYILNRALHTEHGHLIMAACRARIENGLIVNNLSADQDQTQIVNTGSLDEDDNPKFGEGIRIGPANIGTPGSIAIDSVSITGDGTDVGTDADATVTITGSGNFSVQFTNINDVAVEGINTVLEAYGAAKKTVNTLEIYSTEEIRNLIYPLY